MQKQPGQITVIAYIRINYDLTTVLYTSPLTA